MRFLAPILLALTLALSAGPVLAAQNLNQAVRTVKERTDGRILSAHTVRRGDRLVHRIKVLLPNGHVRVVTINGGRVPKQKDRR